MIVVTGSDGIVGRALCRALQMKSAAFLPVTHRRKLHTIKGALEVDLAATVQPLFTHAGEIKTIVHLAAAVPHSSYYPDNENSSNITQSIDRKILELQERTGAHVIYMSTCGLYDRCSAEEKTEVSPIKVTTPYFEAKAKGEEWYTKTGNCTILRLAAPVGPGLKSNLVLSRFVMAARTNIPILVWGSGSREQNYIDCEDVSDLIIRIIERPVGETLNVASNAPTTMLALADTVLSAIGTGSIQMAKESDPRDGETARYSVEKALNLYGWSPRVALTQSIKNIASENFELNK